MLVNITLIPFLLGIFTNVSENSSISNPEYLYEVKQIKTEYEYFTKSTELTSTITCYSIQSKIIFCILHDILVQIVNYDNFNDRITKSNLIQITSSFMMEFSSYGIHMSKIRYNTEDNMIKNFIQNIIEQFHINIGIKTLVLSSGSTDKEHTSIGICTTTYNVMVTYKEKDEYEEMDSNFQIRLIAENFSDKKDLQIKDLHIVKNRRMCDYFESYELWDMNIEMMQYVHIIKVIDNKLKISTKLDGLRPLDLSNSSRKIVFTETTELNLINFRSRKTMPLVYDNLEIYNLTLFEN